MNVDDATACMLDWSLPGGQDCYFKAVSELAAGGCFTGEKVMDISRRFDTNKQDPRSRWLGKLREWRHPNIAAVALANKNARIALLSNGEAYHPGLTVGLA